MVELRPAQFFALGYELAAPCSLSLSNEQVLFIEEVYRILPNKRVVCRAKWNNQTVLAKIFQKSSQHTIEKEKQGTALLQSNNILSPPLINEWLASDCCILFFEFLWDGVTLDSAWKENKTIDFRHSLLDKIIALTITMHQKDLIQTDIHLGNFFLIAEALYLLDPGSIESNTNDTAKQQNLALLCAQLMPTDWGYFFEVLAKQIPNIDKERFFLDVNKAWEKRKKNYLKKIFRNCSSVVFEKSGDSIVACHRSFYTPAVQKLLENPNFAIEHGEILKDGNAQTVCKFSVDGHELVIKRYNPINPIKTFFRQFIRNRAENSWYFSHLLQMLGVSIPAPVAMVIKRKNWFETTSYFISEYIPCRSSHKVLHKNPPSKSVMLAFEQTFKTLQRAGIVHGDAKPHNWLTDNEKIWLIDYDAMRICHRKTSHNDIERFLRGWERYPDLHRQFVALLVEYSVN